MKEVLGVAAFGLKDCVAQPGGSCCELGFYLADAVLPMTAFGRILTCDEAEGERTHTGLYWPPEARIQRSKALRRVPIPYAWRALVEAGDRTIRWDVGRGVSFPLPRILAAHVAGLMADGLSDQGLSQHTDSQRKSRDNLPVVAIPDNLDEFGQEILIREFGALGMQRPMFVWRPVAAALSWLDKVEGDFPSLMGNSPRRMGMNDHIHVIYFGPDALEFTTFRLRVKQHKGHRYVLPLRDRPTDPPRLTGMDWVGRLIEESFEKIDHGAFWQAFINFPEIWEAIAGKAWNQEELPRAWSRGQEWALWNPSLDIYNRTHDVRAGPCGTLRDILRGSCQLRSNEKTLSGSIKDVLCTEVRRMARLFPGGRLRGMIVCGPLVPREVPSWLADEYDALIARGLAVEGKLNEPEAGRLWLCADCADPIAEGAAIYGQRTLAKIPSYLDTLPQVSVLAQGQGQYAWVPLLNAQEVLGGREFRDEIQGRFQLDRGRRKLHVYLRKGPSEEAPGEPEDPFDAQILPFEGVTPCRARLMREVVRQLGSWEVVRQHSFFRGSSKPVHYGLAFAEAFFTGERSENGEQMERSSEEIAKTPFRRAVFDFPSAPAEDVVLDVEVRMRPASGLAKVEIVPQDKSFLEGGRVRLNYSTMRRAARLPKRQRGWPPIQELVVDTEDSLLREGEHRVTYFENTLPTAGNYREVIDGIRDMVLKKMDQRWIADLGLWVRAIDQNGQACSIEGNEIIRRIAEKFESDFRTLDVARMVNGQDIMFSRASWLYTSTPSNVIDYAKSILAAGFRRAKWNEATEAASRTFVIEEDFGKLFQSIAHRAKRTIGIANPFPIQAARAICRVLMFRNNGEKGLDCNMAKLFARRAVERLQEKQEQENFQILYFQLILLLLYLLRYRKTEPLCFDPNSPQTMEVFERAMESMAEAKKFFIRTHGPEKADRVQSIIDGFEKYLHYEGTEDVLTVLGDLAGDMA